MDLHPKQLVRVNVRTIKSPDGPETVVNRHFSVDPRTITLDRLKHLVARAMDVRGEFSLVCRGEGGHMPLLCDWDLEGALSEEPHIDLTLELKPQEPGLDDWVIIFEADIPVAGHEGSAAPQPRKGSFLEQVLQLCTPHSLGGGLPVPLTESEYASLADWPCPLRYAVYRAGGAEPSLRPALWLHLLDVYPAGACSSDREDFLNRKAEEYYGLRHSWQRLVRAGSIPPFLRDVTSLVRKDVRRTDRPLDLDERALYNILTTYAVHHPRVGYCQGMSDLLSPLLHVMGTEARAYVALCGLMLRMRDNFRRDGRSVRAKFRHLRRALRAHDPQLYRHLAQVGALNLLFCYRWLLLDLKREFPYDEMLRLTEVMWSTLRPAHREKGVELYEKRFPDFEDEDDDLDCEEEDMKKRRNTIGRCPSGKLRRRTTGGKCRRTLDEYNLESPQMIVNSEYLTRTVNASDSERGQERTVDERTEDDSYRKRTINARNSERDHKRPVDDANDRQKTRDEEHFAKNGGERIHTNMDHDLEDPKRKRNCHQRPSCPPTPVSLKRWATLSRRQSIAQNIESEDCRSSSSSSEDEEKEDNNECSVFRRPNRRRRLRSRNEDRDSAWFQEDSSSSERRRHGSSDSNYGSNFSEEDEDEDTLPSNSSRRSRSEGYDSQQTLTDHSSSDDDDFLKSIEEDCSSVCTEASEVLATSYVSSRPLLPAPTRLGDGKPFLIFLCLTMITNHRDVILERRMDASEIGIYFDRLVRKHRLADVLPRAKEMFAEYLRTGWADDE